MRSWRYLPGFVIQSLRAARQAKLATGSLSVSILRDADWAFWTRTVWRNEAAMRSFMRAGVHSRVMARLPEWCDEAALVHWAQESSEPPLGRRRIGAYSLWDQPAAYLGDFLARASADWHHSEWDFRKVIAAGVAKVHLDVQFTRYRADKHSTRFDAVLHDRMPVCPGAVVAYRSSFDSPLEAAVTSEPVSDLKIPC